MTQSSPTFDPAALPTRRDAIPAHHTGAAVTPCDNTSVGVLIQDSSNRLLVVDLATPPWGIVCPAGHIGRHHSPEQVATAVVLESVGLQVFGLKLLARRWRDNRCDRPVGAAGIGHECWIYQCRANGGLAPSVRKVRNARWVTPGQLQALVVRTAAYARGQLSAEEWWAGPGIAPVWVLWLSLAGLVTATCEDLAAFEQASTWLASRP
jgi:hypothetical protein